MNLASIENEQTEADDNLFKALEVVAEKKLVVSQKKEVYTLQTLLQQNAENSQAAA